MVLVLKPSSRTWARHRARRRRFCRDEAEGAVVEDPGAAVADFDAGEVAALVPEDLAFVVFAVAVLVFEDDDAVAQLVSQRSGFSA
jgi:hypothetical protein